MLRGLDPLLAEGLHRAAGFAILEDVVADGALADKVLQDRPYRVVEVVAQMAAEFKGELDIGPGRMCDRTYEKVRGGALIGALIR